MKEIDGKNRGTQGLQLASVWLEYKLTQVREFHIGVRFRPAIKAVWLDRQLNAIWCCSIKT